MTAAGACTNCGEPRPADAVFVCPFCGRPYVAEKPSSSSSLNARLLAGITWLTSAAVIGFLAYQQWTFGQSIRGTELNVGGLADRAALVAICSAVSALVTLCFGALVIWRPTRSLLTWSAVWAAAIVTLGVLQILGLLKLGSGAVGDVIILATTAIGAAGLQSFVARQDMPATAQAPKDSGPPPPVATAEPPPAPARPFAPPPRPFAPPPASVTSPVETVVVGGHVIVATPTVGAPREDLTSPLLLPAPREDRTSPVLVLVVLLSGLLALAVVGYAVLAPDGGLLAVLSPTPTPSPTAAPTPVTTIRPVTAAPFAGTGPMTFGVEYSPDSFLILKQATKFSVDVKKIAWNAALLQPAGARALALRFARVLKGGAEEVLDSVEIPLSDPRAMIVAATFDMAAAANNEPGTYVVRLVRGDDVMAEGTFTLVK